MRLAETVTFGGDGLNRRADLRGQSETLARSEDAVHFVFWHGKILLSGQMGLVELPTNAPFLENSGQPPVFLGEKSGRYFFAHDVSPWEPADGIDETVGAFVDQSRQIVEEIEGSPEFCEIRSVMSELSATDAELSATAKSIHGWHASHRFCSQCGDESLSADGGWRRECPSCGGQHFPRTDPVVIMLIEHGNSVLLGRSPGWPEGMFSLLAGFVEPGETMETAVRREVLEEVGVTVGPVGYLASQPWPFPSSLMLGCRGVATSVDITPDPNEIEDALWVTREEMLDVFAGQHPVIRPPRKGAIAGFILEHWLKDQLD